MNTAATFIDATALGSMAGQLWVALIVAVIDLVERDIDAVRGADFAIAVRSAPR